MPRTISTTYNQVTNVHQVVNYNHQVGDQYYIARIQSSVTPMSADGKRGQIVESESLVGTPRTTPFNNQEVYTAIKGNGTGGILARELKKLYTDAIEDVVA
jgi:hypothetical protein